MFMDVETIGPGADFTAAIDEALSSCRIVLVLIGQVWLAGTDASGRRRITDSGRPRRRRDRHGAAPLAAHRAGPGRRRAACPGAPIFRRCWPSSPTRNAVRVDHETFGRDSAVVVETVAETLGPHRRAAARRRLVLPLLAVGLVLLVALGVFVVLPALRNDKVVERVLTGQVIAGVSARDDGGPRRAAGGDRRRQ